MQTYIHIHTHKKTQELTNIFPVRYFPWQLEPESDLSLRPPLPAPGACTPKNSLGTLLPPLTQPHCQYPAIGSWPLRPNPSIRECSPL